MSDESTTALQGVLERAATGDAEARRRLLELTRDRLMGHARHLLHGQYARLEPFAQTDDVVQQLYLKILQQDRFWADADGRPVRTLGEYFGHASAWMRDVLCDLLYGTRFTNYFAGRRKPLAQQVADVTDVLFHGLLTPHEAA